MTLKVRNGFVYNQDGVVVAIMADSLPDEMAEEAERIIEFGSEAAPALTKFIDQINSGSFKPRMVVRELEKIADKYK